MTNLYTLDHSTTIGHLRNYDPIKQYFCLLPHNDTSRPLEVPQNYLIHFDGFLVPFNILTQMVKSLNLIRHLVSSPSDDKDSSYCTAFSKRSYSENELFFISAKASSFMVQSENKKEQKSSPFEHKSPTRNPQSTGDNHSNMLNNRTLCDITQMFGPFKHNDCDSPITTLTHLIDCYYRR